MKNQIYTLADEDFITLLERTHNAFNELRIPFMFVGGVATQTHITNYLCQSAKTLSELVDSPDFRLQDYLRATDDVDITLDKNEFRQVDLIKKIFEAYKLIQGENGLFVSPSENHLVAIMLDRHGAKRPVFKLGIDKEPEAVALDSDRLVSLNFYKGPEDTNTRWSSEIRDFERRYYYDFMNRGVDVKIPYCPGKNITLRVKKAEDLLATKLVRGRPKDWDDILALTQYSAEAGKPIDYNEVGRLLTSEDPKYGKPNLAFVERFEEFMHHINGHRPQ